MESGSRIGPDCITLRRIPSNIGDALALSFKFTPTKMKLNRSLLRAGLLLLLTAAAVLLLTAAQRRQARISQLVRDVNVLAPHTEARPAHVNDNVAEGSAVH